MDLIPGTGLEESFEASPPPPSKSEKALGGPGGDLGSVIMTLTESFLPSEPIYKKGEGSITPQISNIHWFSHGGVR